MPRIFYNQNPVTAEELELMVVKHIVESGTPEERNILANGYFKDRGFVWKNPKTTEFGSTKFMEDNAKFFAIRKQEEKKAMAVQPSEVGAAAEEEKDEEEKEAFMNSLQDFVDSLKKAKEFDPSRFLYLKPLLDKYTPLKNPELPLQENRVEGERMLREIEEDVRKFERILNLLKGTLSPFIPKIDIDFKCFNTLILQIPAGKDETNIENAKVLGFAESRACRRIMEGCREAVESWSNGTVITNPKRPEKALHVVTSKYLFQFYQNTNPIQTIDDVHDSFLTPGPGSSVESFSVIMPYMHYIGTIAPGFNDVGLLYSRAILAVINNLQDNKYLKSFSLNSLISGLSVNKLISFLELIENGKFPNLHHVDIHSSRSDVDFEGRDIGGLELLLQNINQNRKTKLKLVLTGFSFGERRVENRRKIITNNLRPKRRGLFDLKSLVIEERLGYGSASRFQKSVPITHILHYTRELTKSDELKKVRKSIEMINSILFPKRHEAFDVGHFYSAEEIDKITVELEGLIFILGNLKISTTAKQKKTSDNRFEKFLESPIPREVEFVFDFFLEICDKIDLGGIASEESEFSFGRLQGFPPEIQCFIKELVLSTPIVQGSIKRYEDGKEFSVYRHSYPDKTRHC